MGEMRYEERERLLNGHHRSDCAVHNEPAEPNGPCDCGLADWKEGEDLARCFSVENEEGMAEMAYRYKWSQRAAALQQVATLKAEVAELVEVLAGWADCCRGGDSGKIRPTDLPSGRVLRTACDLLVKHGRVRKTESGYAWVTP